MRIIEAKGKNYYSIPIDLGVVDAITKNLVMVGMEPELYELKKNDEGKYFLTHGQDIIQNLEGSFIITKDLELKIGKVSHGFLAGMAESVLAAGELVMKGGRITSITNQSGTYHFKNLTQEEYNFAQESFKKVLGVVNLPIDTYSPHPQAKLTREQTASASEEGDAAEVAAISHFTSSPSSHSTSSQQEHSLADTSQKRDETGLIGTPATRSY